MSELERILKEIEREKDSFLTNVSDKDFNESMKKLEDLLEKKSEEIEIAKEKRPLHILCKHQIS
jgi:uncharacterized membrane protein YgaE (UPF0421/DUF939 family)